MAPISKKLQAIIKRRHPSWKIDPPGVQGAKNNPTAAKMNAARDAALARMKNSVARPKR